ncbi:DUF732 domain-containing protein [Mycolicibacterium sediminis]|uniref:DUF732 domain-containing protein n=1 Tax=Mycolicibacterium sediminis TaxID=1286180 RepID=UPI001FEADE13|nr:DUF732 domain-containing protein [Mycolicibacterium sediminis]
MRDEGAPTAGASRRWCELHRCSRLRSTGAALPMSLVVAFAALSVSACGMSGEDVIATMGLPTSATAGPGSDAQAISQMPPGQTGGVAGAIQVTPKQRAYLDALTRGGVDPSSELTALSIGSYVCQAHAAHQSDQAVWDFVVPMVRDDVRDSTPGSEPLPAGQVDSVTADYIRIATDRLC